MLEFQRQLELETDAVQIGIKRYRDKVAKSDLTDLAPGIRLTKMALEPMAKAIAEEMEAEGPGGHAQYRKFYRKFDPMTIAFIVANRIIQSIGASYDKPESLQNVAIGITDRLLMQLDYEQFKAEAPGYVYAIEQDNRWASESHRRATIMRAKKKFSGRTSMDSKERFKIGHRLVQMFIASTGLVEAIPTEQGSLSLMPSSETLEYIERSHGECELLQPMTMPMVVPPKPWLTTYGGGFISNHHHLRYSLVKTRDREELYHLGLQEMPMVYNAINKLQDTEWRVNDRVLETMKELWQHGGVAGLPNRELPPIPPKPWGLGVPTQEQLVAWKKTATKVYETHARETSKRVNMEIKLHVADRLRHEKSLYFVWTMDWRGRMYPVQQFLNPQGDDTSRSLIEFSLGHAIGTNGKFWLAVHGANCWGFDKVSFRERVDFIYEMEKEIFAFADDPVGMVQHWGAADKPFQFLAFCFEWTEMRRTPIQGAYISHLPVSLDGSCNGLQNFSALLLDEVGGLATNLVPGEKPADVYQEVADKVNALLQQDILSDDPEVADKAHRWAGLVTRKVVKRGVMTTPYGVTKYGMKDQLRHECEKIRKNYLNLPPGEKHGPYYRYLAEHLWTAIGMVVVAAREAMLWLQDVAKICTDSDTIIRWTTPIGFRPKQDYRKKKLLRVNTLFGGVRMQFGLLQDTERIDSRKMLNGIAPNYIHSLDAAHAMHTVNNLYFNHGITDFAMVHDSFAVHAAYVQELAYELREAFISMYSLPVLEIFGAEIFNQVGVELPPLPPKGNLELSQVRNSKYFFG